MSTFCRITFANQVITPIPATTPPSKVLTFIQSPKQLIGLSPLVTKYTFRDLETREFHTVHTFDCWETVDISGTAAAKLLRSWSPKRQIHFTSSFWSESAEVGCTNWVEAPLGLVSKAVYRVRKRTEADGVNGAGEGKEEWVLEESVTSSVNRLLRFTVEGLLVETREKIHQKMFEIIRDGA